MRGVADWDGPKTPSLVSSGDGVVYSTAVPTLEVLAERGWKGDADEEVEVSKRRGRQLPQATLAVADRRAPGRPP